LLISDLFHCNLLSDWKLQKVMKLLVIILIYLLIWLFEV
jgi:hypothetical protein